MTYSEKAKISNYKWREENREHYNDIQRDFAKKTYEKHKKAYSQKALDRYYIKKEMNALLDIMMN